MYVVSTHTQKRKPLKFRFLVFWGFFCLYFHGLSFVKENNHSQKLPHETESGAYTKIYQWKYDSPGSVYSILNVLPGKDLRSHLWIDRIIPVAQGCTKKQGWLTELIILYTLVINS